MKRRERRKEFYKRYSWAKKAYKNLGLQYDPVDFIGVAVRGKDNITFEQYLRFNEARLLEPTNIYEMIRFKVCDGTICIIYQGKRGLKYSNDLARKIYNDWESTAYKEDCIVVGSIAEKKDLHKIAGNNEKNILIKYIDEVKLSHKNKLYKFISDEMGFLINKQKIKKINSIQDLRIIYRLITQYKNIFIND